MTTLEEKWIGKPFGRLTVVRRAENRGKQPYWVCQCVCGNEVEVRASHLSNGTTRKIVVDGIAYTPCDVADLLGTTKSTIHNRIKRGWTDEEIIRTPVAFKGGVSSLV